MPTVVYMVGFPNTEGTQFYIVLGSAPTFRKDANSLRNEPITTRSRNLRGSLKDGKTACTRALSGAKTAAITYEVWRTLITSLAVTRAPLKLCAEIFT